MSDDAGLRFHTFPEQVIDDAIRDTVDPAVVEALVVLQLLDPTPVPETIRDLKAVFESVLRAGIDAGLREVLQSMKDAGAPVEFWTSEEL